MMTTVQAVVTSIWEMTTKCGGRDHHTRQSLDEMINNHMTRSRIMRVELLSEILVIIQQDKESPKENLKILG